MRPRISQRRLGLGLMAMALVGAMVAAPAAAAQEEPEEVETPVEAKALVAYPLNDVIPDTILTAFPPQVVCLVEPQLCPESLKPVRDPIAENLGAVNDNQETSPFQPANPDGLTVTYTGGVPRYASAVRVTLPEVPEGHEVDQFVLRFPQGQPSFSFDSPAFRRIVLGAVAAAGAGDPAVFQEQLAKALEEEEPLAEPLMGIEACPLTVAIPEGAEPPRSTSIASISEENVDGEQVPAVDCLYGANGTFDGDTQTWSFDLTFAAKAWNDGTLENRGVLLRPTGAPNLAFGDPDTSTNAQTVLDVSAPPTATFASSEPPPPPAPLAPLPPPSQPSTASNSGTSPSTVSAPPSSGMFSAPPPSPSGGSSTPTTPPAEVAPPETAPAEPAPVALDAEPASAPGTPWTVWLLLVPFVGGAVLVSRSLTEELAVATAGRGGALTRLVQHTPTA